MSAIVHIETIVPEFCYSQTEIAETMKSMVKDRKALQYLNSLYSESGIEYRHSVLSDYRLTVANKNNSDQPAVSMPTGSRNKIFAEESKKLISRLAQKTFKNYKKIKPSEITHLITVSCTGFYNPGPDMQLISELGLSTSVERYQLGFMGCYAAFPALRMAKQICQSSENAKVLILCLELCTLHFQNEENLDVLLANSIFADGAAIVLVENNLNNQQLSIELESFSSQLLPEAEKDMAWTIGNSGFEMVLSRYIPKVIAANISELVHTDLNPAHLTLKDIDLWAVHPGGKSILDKVEESLGIQAEQLWASRQILRDYGNMSSVTILFVLNEILTKSASASQQIYGLAFGPGLVIESALLKYHPGVT